MSIYFSSKSNWVSHDSNRSKSKHTHPYHQLVYCSKGKAFQLTRDGEEQLETGDLFFFPAHQLHNTFCYSEQECEIIVHHFDDRIFHSDGFQDQESHLLLKTLKSQFHKKSKIKLSTQQQEKAETLVLDSHHEYRSQQFAWRSIVRGNLSKFLATCVRSDEVLPEISHLKDANGIDKITDYIEKRFMFPINVEEILANFNLKSSTFHASFKSKTGKTFTEYLNLVRIKHAKELLSSKIDILNIALDCGFNHQSYFCRIFKKYTGLTPNEFRKNLKG